MLENLLKELWFLACQCRSAGRVYHVLIFHKAGLYYLDSAEEGEGEATFGSLDDLVVFCMGHELRVEGTEVQLHEAVPCNEEAGAHVKAVSLGRMNIYTMHFVREFLYECFPFTCTCSPAENKSWGR